MNINPGLLFRLGPHSHTHTLGAAVLANFTLGALRSGAGKDPPTDISDKLT